jgi:hypothetical protein
MGPTDEATTRMTSDTNRDATGQAGTGHARRARLLTAVVLLAVIGTASARAMAAPVGPIDAPGRGSTAVAAQLSYGIDGQGRVDTVTVLRDGTAPDQTVTVELAGENGQSLARVTTDVRGARTVVPLAASVDPARVTGAGVRTVTDHR